VRFALQNDTHIVHSGRAMLAEYIEGGGREGGREVRE